MVQASVTTLALAAGGTNIVVAELYTGNVGAWLQYCQLIASDTNPGTFYLRKTLTAGTTPVPGIPYCYGTPPPNGIQTRVARSWAVAPLAATGPIAFAANLAGVVGNTFEWDFTKACNRNGEGLGLFIPPNTGVSIVAQTAVGAPYCNFQFLEL